MSNNPVKVVTLQGSLRKGSYNAMVERALVGLAPKGMQIESLPSLGEIPFYNSDVQASTGIPLQVQIIADKIRQADGVIIVSPEYNYSFPATIKNAIDWISRTDNQPFAGKPVALQTSSMGPIGGARCQYHLRQVMVFLDAMVLNKPEFMAGIIQNKVDEKSQTITDQMTIDTLAQQLVAFKAFIERLR